VVDVVEDVLVVEVLVVVDIMVVGGNVVVVWAIVVVILEPKVVVVIKEGEVIDVEIVSFATFFEVLEQPVKISKPQIKMISINFFILPLFLLTIIHGTL
jgi:hypothetical protein